MRVFVPASGMSGHRRRRTAAILTVTVALSFAVASAPRIVASPPSAGAGAQAGAPVLVPGFQAWQVIDAAAGRVLSPEEWPAVLAGADVIYLGEEHRNRYHVEAALTVLEGLLARHRRPVLAMEMFSWDGQAGLDRYLTGAQATRDGFLKDSHWEQNWGGAFEDYEPLVAFARDRHLAVLALNPPRSLVRRVATLGLVQTRAEPEMARWGLQDERPAEDPAYREKILDQLRRCHGGLTEEGYGRMYEASAFRDEMMARTIADRLAAIGSDGGAGPIVSYTGGGHIQYRLPVPSRVLRRHGKPVRQVTVYLHAYAPGSDREVRELIGERIADYLWLTPVGQHGPAKRCR